MEEKELEKIENDILDSLRDRLKNLTGKELENVVEAEIKKRNYLSEDYHIYYATQRIIESFKKEGLKNKKEPLSTKPITKARKIWLWICIIVLSFFFIFLLTELISGIYFFLISGGKIKSSDFLNWGNFIFAIASGYGIIKIPKTLNLSKKIKRAILAINIGLAIILFIMLNMWFSSGSANRIVSIDFKNISSEQTIAEINKLSNDKQTTAYKQHSELGNNIGKIWTENLNAENKNFDLAFQKTLPILISQGWSDQAARDILSWEINKSLVILYRDPSWWCKSGDCTAKSDAEIKTILEEDESLSESVILGIFQELRVDEGLTPLP